MGDKDRCDISYCKIEGLGKIDLGWYSITPVQYRLCKNKNGELILQGEYQTGGTKDGIPYSGYEWKDIETVVEV